MIGVIIFFENLWLRRKYFFSRKCLRYYNVNDTGLPYYPKDFNLLVDASMTIRDYQRFLASDFYFHVL